LDDAEPDDAEPDGEAPDGEPLVGAVDPVAPPLQPETARSVAVDSANAAAARRPKRTRRPR